MRDSFIDVKDANEEIVRFVEYSKRKRPHSVIFFLTPEEVMAGHMLERLDERQARADRAQHARRMRQLEREQSDTQLTEAYTK